MSISILKCGKASYYKISRKWNGKNYQRYVRIDNKKKALKEAQHIEQQLAQRQTAYNEMCKINGKAYLTDNGKILGLRRKTVKRKNRHPVDVFELRIKAFGSTKPVMTTISISKYGFDEAFRMAIDKICALHHISKESTAYKVILAAKPLYNSIKKGTARITASPSLDLSQIQKNLEKSASAFKTEV